MSTRRLPLVVFAVGVLPVLSATGFAASPRAPQPSLAKAKEILEGLNRQVGLASLKDSPHLSMTREMLKRPGSDWGLEGLGQAFTEKRSALANLALATRTSASLARELQQLRQQVSKFDLVKRFKISRIAAALDKGRAQIAAERERLRQTSTIWHQQGELTYSADRETRQVIQDVLDDRPARAEAVKGHIDRYLSDKYGLK
jgi:hypothetical protein